MVVIELNVSDQERIPASTWIPPSWPPRVPVIGEYVAFAGFPDEYRINERAGVIDLAVIGGIMRVESSTGRRFGCVMERERLIKTRGPGVPPPGARLWGMSGGPVFRLEGETMELTGIITDFGPNFEIFLMTPLGVAALNAQDLTSPEKPKPAGQGKLKSPLSGAPS